MSKKNWSNILSVLARPALAFVFVFGQTAWAGQSQNTTEEPGSSWDSKANSSATQGAGVATKASAAQRETAIAQWSSLGENAPGVGQEGIKVHGHWTIEVHNGDGSLVARRVFENAYQPSSLLASLLARQASAGYWKVGLNGSVSAPSPCGNVECAIYETGYPLVTPIAPGLAQGLMVTANAGTNTLVLAGSVTAPTAGTISLVYTSLTELPRVVRGLSATWKLCAPMCYIDTEKSATLT